MNNTRNATDISRDEFVRGIEAVFGNNPSYWDGMTHAEISQALTPIQLNQVYSYLGVTV